MRGAALFCATILTAQTLSFEVASIRPSVETPGQEGAGRGITANPAGVTALRQNVRDLVEWAWDLREYQLLGPDWINFDRYDVSTRTGAPATRDDLRAMMRALLAERFRLRLRRESRTMPVYALSPGAASHEKLAASKHETEGMSRLPGGGLRLEFRRTSMARLAAFLSTLAAMDRPVLDNTGLDGLYDFGLDLHEAAGPWSSDAERLSAPSFGAVIQQQLGLRLEARRSAIEVFAIEQVERPTAN
jgi:uncharacterized protein (TIGR03435 family)